MWLSTKGKRPLDSEWCVLQDQDHLRPPENRYGHFWWKRKWTLVSKAFFGVKCLTKTEPSVEANVSNVSYVSTKPKHKTRTQWYAFCCTNNQLLHHSFESVVSIYSFHLIQCLTYKIPTLADTAGLSEIITGPSSVYMLLMLRDLETWLPHANKANFL